MAYRPLTSNPEAKLYHICSMLNYCLVDHGARFRIRHVFSITREMLAEFFDHYAIEKAVPESSSLKGYLNSERYQINDEDLLKQLTGLK